MAAGRQGTVAAWCEEQQAPSQRVLLARHRQQPGATTCTPPHLLLPALGFRRLFLRQCRRIRCSSRRAASVPMQLPALRPRAPPPPAHSSPEPKPPRLQPQMTGVRGLCSSCQPWPKQLPLLRGLFSESAGPADRCNPAEAVEKASGAVGQVPHLLALAVAQAARSSGPLKPLTGMRRRGGRCVRRTVGPGRRRRQHVKHPERAVAGQMCAWTTTGCGRADTVGRRTLGVETKF